MPDISFVVTARNDNHGGGFLQRFHLFMEGLATLAEKHGLNAELILVEWNPPQDTPGLMDAVRWRRSLAPLHVRVITVTPELHTRFPNSDRIPIFQMIAKNVGIRRACGRFVLATNVDLLFSDELIRFLAQGRLNPECLYRVDRYDVDKNVPHNAPVEEQIRYCRNNVLRIHKRGRTVTLHSNSPGYITQRARQLGLRTWLGSISRRIGNHLSGYSILNAHTNACGDFTLMSRERFHALRGYPEFPTWSMHIDSLLCFMALFSGLKEVVLKDPMRVYHIEHGMAWAMLSPEQKVSRFMEVPWIDWGVVTDIVARMLQEKRIPVLNQEDWGLGKMDLPESHYGSILLQETGMPAGKDLSPLWSISLPREDEEKISSMMR